MVAMRLDTRPLSEESEELPPGPDGGSGPTADRSRRPWLYAAAIVALAVAAGTSLGPRAWPRSEAVYGALGVGILVGALLSVRIRRGALPVTLILVPALLAYARLDAAALLLVGWASFAAAVVRGGRWPGALLSPAHDVLAFVVGVEVAGLLPPGIVLRGVVFAVAFAVVQAALWRVAARLHALPARRAGLEHPRPLLALTLAPLAALPVVAGRALGDGALILTLAGLLAVLVLVREATNLSTARVEAEAERDRLARANALQEELVHLITHELKNPLTTILARAQLARMALDRGTIERLPDNLKFIEQSAHSMERLVENLLQISRLEQSGELPPPEPITLPDFLASVVAEFGPQAEERALTLALNCPPGLPPFFSPPLLLREVLNNLVSNAIKYTPAGGTVTLAAAAPSDPPEVHLSVSDTGIGMSQEDLERLFTRFFRSANPEARKERGSGLGLALTQAVVRRLGGRITVRSELAAGTTFTVSLPLAPQRTD